MDRQSIISLSSTTSQPSPSEESVSIVSVSSESQRVPVSWDSPRRSKENITDLGESLNNFQKVKEWMTTWNNNNGNAENNKTTCIRYDFDKSTRTASLPTSCYTRATPLFSYMEEVKKNSINNNNNNRYTHTKNTDHHRLNGIHKGNSNIYDTPLSPESQKKELCKYLQLMKPGDTKETKHSVDQRRSSRVMIQNREIEKKKLDKKDMDNKSFEESEMEKSTNESKKREAPNKYMPLPAKKFYERTRDFEESVKQIVEETNKSTNTHVNGCIKQVENRRKFKFTLKRPQNFKKGKFNARRLHSLRSKGYLRSISLDTLILRKSHLRKKVIQQRKIVREIKGKLIEEKEPIEKESDKKSKEIVSPRCEIITVHMTSDDENIDLKNFVDDMLELDKMSEEHRRNVIESRILTSSSITNLINKQTNQEEDVQRAYKIFSELSIEKKNSEEKENVEKKENSVKGIDEGVNSEDKENNSEQIENTIQETYSGENLAPKVISSEHDYAADLTTENTGRSEEEEGDDEESIEDEECLSPVPIPNIEILPVSKEIEMKSLHRSLAPTTKCKLFSNNYLHNWNSGSKGDNKKLNHSISISKHDGAILRAFYQDYNLVVIQESSVSFWTQSALGNVLGAQNMWIPKGQSQRIPLNSTYIQKDAMEMVITTETSVAYVELWTKEHKSAVREVPVADVFATVYFWRLRQNGLDKKALQLENIKGFTDDVQYCVLKCYPRIIVSWHSVQGSEKKTKIHSYHLAADFQTVANISEIQPVEHYVSSLHNIEDCDNLVMGCGENKITLWNVDYGYIVATIELSNIKSPLSTLWVKCDRGFLFTIQECVDQELRLIAINGMNHSWKKLQNYNPLQGFDSLKGVCIENGILVAYYNQGILCWNAQTGELIVEEVPNECEYIPSGKHVIVIVNDKVIVKHSLSHLITADEF